jgi:hypothetical protein
VALPKIISMGKIDAKILRDHITICICQKDYDTN